MHLPDLSSLQAYAVIASAVITTCGLVFVVLQLRELKLSVRSAAHAAIYERAAELRSLLVEYPRFRKYLFEGVEIDETNEDYGRLLSVAEMYLNYLEHIFLTNDSLGRKNKTSAKQFVSSALKKSPILRKRLNEAGEDYSLAFRQFAKDGTRSNI